MVLLLLAIGIAFISTLIQSLTGFGFAIVSTPLLLMVYDAKEVVVLLQFLSVILDTVFVFFVKDNIDWHFLKPLLIGSVIGHPIGILIYLFVLLFFIFLPRPRGFRVNRKKRVIYWQTIFGSHAIAFVPEQGDPLGGINYSRFGLYAFGGHERFSLQLWIDDYLSKRRVTALFGVYPSPSSEHNAQILHAIRAYLTEDNPEFLKYVGRDFKNFGLKFNIALCNAFALRVPFSRKKADRAIELALVEWNKKTPNQKQGWFNERRATQKLINERHLREELDNEVK